LPITRASGLVKLADYQPGETFGPRRLTDWEFVWLVAGSAVWTTSRGVAGATVQSRLGVGDLALGRVGVVDSYQWDRSVPSRHAYVHFTLVEQGDLAAQDDWPAVRALHEHPVLDGLCRRLVELGASADTAAQARTDQLVGVLLDAFVGLQVDAPLPQHVQVIADHVAATWARDGVRLIEVDELAAAAGLSSGHIFRVFRNAYGCSPARALELLRLARAATALERSNATLARVAAGSGFANPYHLSRRFRAVYGCPPGAYRQRASGPDPLEPLREAGLLGLARAVLPVRELQRSKASG
jgi:AraC family transcriptional regulator